jgi:hypothetical protein
MENSIYEVTREDYKAFVNEIKPEFRDVKTEQIGTTKEACKIYSKKTGKCLCSRVTYTAEYGIPEPERYYIFEMPDDEERGKAVPTIKITLDSREAVQKFFTFLAEQKEKKDD